MVVDVSGIVILDRVDSISILSISVYVTEPSTILVVHNKRFICS